MFSRKGIAEFVIVSRTALNVVSQAAKSVSNDVAMFYNTSQLTKNCRVHDEMYKDLQQQAQTIREQHHKTRTHHKKTHKPTGKRHYSTNSKPSKPLKAVPIKEDEYAEIPSSKLQRLFHYGHLAVGVGVNVLGASIKNAASGNKSTVQNVTFTNDNFKFISDKFRKMRGAALKVGQMLSIQDESFLPKELSSLLSSVQSSGVFMPTRQLHHVLAKNFGSNWRDLFTSFEDRPFAAASISEIHKAVLKNGDTVAIKVQYPGVKQSIDSDMDYILWVMKASSMLPKGTFPEKSIKNARDELKDECDFNRESNNIKKFRELLKDDKSFRVPKVYDELTTDEILTMEYLEGVEVIKGEWDQQTKDLIATNIMKLCLREIAEFKFMQTDPNWANFLFNAETKQIELVDFGASREYGAEFIEKYVNCLQAAVRGDRKKVEEYSLKMGFLTGFESEEMVNAHVDSVMILAEPFAMPRGESYNFKNQDITIRIKEKMKIMLDQRLTSPPQETYSLHRKFSGVYLLATKLGATVPCHELFAKYFKV